jgi:hypothetical protein
VVGQAAQLREVKLALLLMSSQPRAHAHNPNHSLTLLRDHAHRYGEKTSRHLRVQHGTDVWQNACLSKSSFLLTKYDLRKERHILSP